MILRAYVKATEIWRRPAESFSGGIYLILDLCLVTRFDMYPTLLVPGAIGRMGMGAIQSLFYLPLAA